MGLEETNLSCIEDKYAIGFHDGIQAVTVRGCKNLIEEDSGYNVRNSEHRNVCELRSAYDILNSLVRLEINGRSGFIKH